MLRKTMAMAVLILMIASLFSGSLGPVQGDAPATNDEARLTSGLYWSTFPTPHTGKAVMTGFFGTSDEAAADIPAGGVIFTGTSEGGAVTCARTESTGAGVPETAGIMVNNQIIAMGDGEKIVTTMVVYVNDTIKIPAPDPGQHWDKNGTFRTFSHKAFGAAYEPGALSVDGKVALFWPGKGEPDMYDMRWENSQSVLFGEKAPPAEFRARLVIPGANGSELIPLPELPDINEFVLDSDITLNMANLTFKGEVPAQDSALSEDGVYNNDIRAGETKWHSADISGAVESINVDLKWREGGNPLELTIYTPDGKVLGPYDDSSDGAEDGRINLNVAKPSGVADGEWYLKVTDKGVSGDDEYYVKTY